MWSVSERVRVKNARKEKHRLYTLFIILKEKRTYKRIYVCILWWNSPHCVDTQHDKVVGILGKCMKDTGNKTIENKQ